MSLLNPPLGPASAGDSSEHSGSPFTLDGIAAAHTLEMPVSASFGTGDLPDFGPTSFNFGVDASTNQV